MRGLDIKTRKLILRCLVEGQSIRATPRTADVSKNTVSKLLTDAGMAGAAGRKPGTPSSLFARGQCGGCPWATGCGGEGCDAGGSAAAAADGPGIGAPEDQTRGRVPGPRMT